MTVWVGGTVGKVLDGDLGELDLGPGSPFTSFVTLGRSLSMSDF